MLLHSVHIVVHEDGGVEGAGVAYVSTLASGGGLNFELEDHAHVREWPDFA